MAVETFSVAKTFLLSCDQAISNDIQDFLFKAQGPDFSKANSLNNKYEVLWKCRILCFYGE